jgi:hypothetical protein
MSWDAIGAIGEMVGAIAVVITLVYLSVQTRQNTRAVRHATTRGVMEDANAWRFRIVEDPAVSELFREGLRDPTSLSANDRYRFRMLLDALVFHWQHAVLADEPIPDVNVTRVLRRPGGRWYWSRTKDQLTPEFIAYVEARLEAAESSDPSRGDS